MVNKPVTAGAKGKDIGKLVLFAAIVLSLIVLARLFGLGERLQELRDWIAGMGNLGMVAYVGLYIVAVVAAVPGLPISIAGAAIFGALKGVILVSIGSTLGASLAFLIARYLARDAIYRRLSGNDKFQRLDGLTEQHGAIIVAITRLVPLFPFNLLNYGFGLTRIPFLDLRLLVLALHAPGHHRLPGGYRRHRSARPQQERSPGSSSGCSLSPWRASSWPCASQAGS